MLRLRKDVERPNVPSTLGLNGTLWFNLCLYSTGHEKQWHKTPTHSNQLCVVTICMEWYNFQCADELIDASRGFGSDDDVDIDGVGDIMLPVQKQHFNTTLQQTCYSR
jgi:hypothetical protein